jgi:threonine dehydrogenase-like Zn-dependent dehydrogenase
MKAVVFHGVGDIRLDNVTEPSIKQGFDAIVRLTASAICGTDLHFVRGTVPGMQEGTILGHEGVGVVEEVGKAVRNVKPGDRAVIASTIACGALSIIGVYPETAQTFPIGIMNKNLNIRQGNCNHRKYIQKLVDLIRTDVVNPSSVLTNLEPLTSAIEAYKLFDRREPGWTKVELLPAA